MSDKSGQDQNIEAVKINAVVLTDLGFSLLEIVGIAGQRDGFKNIEAAVNYYQQFMSLGIDRTLFIKTLSGRKGYLNIHNLLR